MFVPRREPLRVSPVIAPIPNPRLRANPGGYKMFCALVWAGLAVVQLHAQNAAAWQHQAWGTAEGLPQNSVHAIAQAPDGFLWVATEAGLARFDGVQFKTYSGEALGHTASEDLCCLAVDSGGVLWVGSSLGLAAFDHSRVLPLPEREPFTGNAIRRLFVQSGHAVAVTEAGAFRLEPDGRAEKVGAMSVASPQRPLILKDHTGNTWIGSANGLQEISRGQSSAANIPSLTGQSILSLLEDTEGDVWVGTEITGLHRLHPGVFHALAGSQGTPATAVAWFSGGVLLGTRKGELRLILPNGKVRPLAHFGAAVTALATTADAAWVGTTDGLYRVDSNSHMIRYTSADGLPDDYIRSVAIGDKGDVWAGTEHGLAHVTRTHIEILTASDGLGGDLIGALLPVRMASRQPAGVWVATESGLYLVEGSHVAHTIKVAGSVVANMAYDQSGTLWFATQNDGLWQYRGGAAQKVLQLSAASARQSVQALFVDQRNTLWIVRRDGVLSASIPRLSACTPQICSSLTSLVASWGVADGMPSAESLPGNLGRPVQDGQGNILFATRAGIAIADPEQAARTFHVPLVIERVELEGQGLDAQQLQSIPYGRTRLTFDYDGISLGEPSRVRYRVRLRGFDSDWVETGTHRSATYTALPPGHYQFEVQATLEGHAWPKASASLAFRIAPPFYRRWWFLLVACVVLGGLVLLFYRLRLAAERRRFALVMAERNRLAREVHDTLAQDLVSTGIQLDVSCSRSTVSHASTPWSC